LRISRPIIGVVAALAIAILAYAFWPRANGPVDLGGVDQVVPVAEDDQSILAGNVRRPKTDLSGDSDVALADDDQAKSDVAGSLDYGTTTPLALDANPHVAAVAKVIANREKDPAAYRSAVSAFGKPAEFDFERFQNNDDYRNQYLVSVEPARVFQPAQPAEGVEKIRALSPLYQVVKQGEVTRLRVLGEPQSPYTFTSLDLGRFSENSLTTVTVQSDENGVASAEFFAAPGTIADARILVAGPRTSGQVRYVVNIEMPE